MAKRVLAPTDARAIAVEQRLSDEQWKREDENEARDRRLRREYVAALTWVSDACDKNFTRVRSFRNIVLATSAGLAVVAITLGVIGATSPESLPLCFDPGTAEQVCPTGAEQGPTGGDAPLLLAVGLTAGAFAAALSVRGIRGTSTPYGVPVAIAWLKVPAGALTALFGMLMVRGGFIPGLSALDTQGQIIAYAIVLGYAQQVFTRLIDTQAQAVMDKAPSSEPATASKDPAAIGGLAIDRRQLTASTAAIALATAASSPKEAPSAISSSNVTSARRARSSDSTLASRSASAPRIGDPDAVARTAPEQHGRVGIAARPGERLDQRAHRRPQLRPRPPAAERSDHVAVLTDGDRRITDACRAGHGRHAGNAGDEVVADREGDRPAVLEVIEGAARRRLDQHLAGDVRAHRPHRRVVDHVEEPPRRGEVVGGLVQPAEIAEGQGAEGVGLSLVDDVAGLPRQRQHGVAVLERGELITGEPRPCCAAPSERTACRAPDRGRGRARRVGASARGRRVATRPARRWPGRRRVFGSSASRRSTVSSAQANTSAGPRKYPYQ